MAGENVTLSVAGYGVRRIAVTRIAFGLQFVTSEDQSSTTKAMYMHAVNQTAFTLTAKFASRADRDSFYAWAAGYAAAVSNPTNTLAAPMRVQGPRNFDWYAILSSGVQALTTPHDVTWEMLLGFEGAHQLGTPLKSSFVSALVDSSFSDLFYPGGNQLSGLQSVQDTLYNGPAVVPPAPAAIPVRGGVPF